MESFFITVMFLAFCITVIALTTQNLRISLIAIKTLGKFLKFVLNKFKDK